MKYKEYKEAVRSVYDTIERIKTSDNKLFNMGDVRNLTSNYWITCRNGNSLSAKDWIINIFYYRIEDDGASLSLDRKDFNSFKDSKRLQIFNTLYHFILIYGTLLEVDDENLVHSYKELVDICERYKEVDMNTVFDKWYDVNYGRTKKLLKLLKYE